MVVMEMANTFILFGIDLDYMESFVVDKLKIKKELIINYTDISNDKIKKFEVILCNNFKDDIPSFLKRCFPNSTCLFFTKDIVPGQQGVWDADYIIDRKEDIEKWKSCTSPF
jgi:hypothetical protein